MFIWFVLLVSVNFVTIKSEHDHIKIMITKDEAGKCVSTVEPKSIKLVNKSNFNLTVRSNHFYILESNWMRGQKTVRLENLNDSAITIKYENTDKKNFTYKYFHTEKANSSLKGNWTFSFNLSDATIPVRFLSNRYSIIQCVVNTTVEITGDTPTLRSGSGTYNVPSNNQDSQQSNFNMILIIMLSILGVILIIQSFYIIRVKKEPSRNIANRPPLPLPADEVREVTPSSRRRLQLHCTIPTAPPMPVQNSYTTPRSPNFSKRTYGNEGLDTSDEIIRSPKFGRSQADFLVPKKSYKALDHSVEDLRSPGFHRKRNGSPMLPNQLSRKNASTDEDSDEEPKIPGFIRKQIEVKQSHLPPKPVKHPKPLPRAPATPPTEKPPVLKPATRTDPVPPLPPLPQRKVPAYPTPASFRPDHRRLSDDEWQYEALKPSSNYLNNFQSSNYNNTLA